MSGSTGNIDSELARHEQELKHGESEIAKHVQRTTGDIARQGHGALNMGPPEHPGETHQVAEEVKAAHEQHEAELSVDELSVEEKRERYERAVQQLREDGEEMLRRTATVA